MEHIPSREANIFLAGSKYFLHFMGTESSLQHLQQPVTCPYPRHKAYIATKQLSVPVRGFLKCFVKWQVHAVRCC
jgi:hypothetical protein